MTDNNNLLNFEKNIIFAPKKLDVVNWFIFIDYANISASLMSE